MVDAKFWVQEEIESYWTTDTEFQLSKKNKNYKSAVQYCDYSQKTMYI